MSEPKRLHPIAIVFNVMKTLKDFIIPIVFLTVFPGGNWKLPYIQGLILSGICIIVIVLAIVSWLRFTYRIEDGELKIESGVFVRKKRYIRFERIHSIDVSEGIVQRLFGLVKINIETAGGTQAEAVLSAIRKHEAEKIIAYLQEVKRNKHLMYEEINESLHHEISQGLYKISFPELLLMSATSGAVGVVLSGMGAFVSQFDEIIPLDRLLGGSKDIRQMDTFILISIAIAGLFLIYVAAILGMMLKYAHFTVHKKEDELVISRGLLEKRQLTIPLIKIQGIRILENVVREPLGYATVYLEYAGGSVEEKESLTVMLFPLIKKKRIQEQLEQLIPNYFVHVSATPVPAKAYPRYVIRILFFFIPIILATVYFIRPWGYLSILLVPIGFGWAFLQYKAAGWNITSSQLLIRNRFISKQTLLFHKNKIQSIESKLSWTQKHMGVATISALIKSGVTFRKGEVRDIKVEDVKRIQTWFLFRKRS